MAQRFLDKFNALQTATESDRPAATFQNNWGDDIKLEIPETGLKVGEVEKLFRDRFGNVSHVTGDVYKTSKGIAVTARLGDAPPRTFEGSRADLDTLLQQAAESVYGFSQPYRFSGYLEQHGRIEEAVKVISDLAANGPLGTADDTSFLQANAISAFMGLPGYWLAAERGEWPAALSDARAADAWLEDHKSKLPVMGLMQSVWLRPLEALAMAKAGDVAGAETLIATTPADCYLCLRIQIATQKHDWPTAERWFAEATRQAPSIGFAFSDWGAERLGHGDTEGAIAVLQQSHAVAPHFAEPLELTGEALMRKGDYRGAIAKFTLADGAAPRWGANHLHWGESLRRAGYERDAKIQLEKARSLSLLAADRAELETSLR